MRAIPGRKVAWAVGIGMAVVATGASAATLTVYESRMPDGSMVVGDKPAKGAKSVKTHRYDYTPSNKAHVEAEREYWRRESNAFAQRYQASQAYQYSTWRAPVAVPQSGYYEPSSYGGYYGHFHYGAGAPLVPNSVIQPNYTTSPGAVNGRGAGFIGSGFSTAR